MPSSGNSQKPSLSFSCPEDWNKMAPCGQGRFCGSCQKTVIDFTQKSDGEIQMLLAKREGEVCGRFFSQQLAQPIKSRFSFRKVFSSVLVLLGLSFLSKEAEAQVKKAVVKKPQNQKMKKKDQELTPVQGYETGIVALEGPLPDADVVYNAEIMPQFKYGDMPELQSFLNENKKTFKNCNQGRVITSFIIDTLGRVNDIRILKGVSEEIDKEAIRLANLLEFNPGMQNGRKVRVRFTLVIPFNKEENE
jgi:TonB family protein